MAGKKGESGKKCAACGRTPHQAEGMLKRVWLSKKVKDRIILCPKCKKELWARYNDLEAFKQMRLKYLGA